jgi:hypothetical protein
MTTQAIDSPDLTRTCQAFTTAGLLAALESAWAAIRARHPQVPAAVLIVGSGSPAKPNAHMKWGHFATLRWQHGDHQLPEVLVSGEGLSRTPAEVFTTLLHEATHGLADSRGIQDTSRQGRWHNKKFATLAAELGLTATKDDKLGYSPCTLTEQAVGEYAEAITAIGAALNAYRHPDLLVGTQRTNNNNGASCECECPRKIRLSVTAFDEGPIVCAVCNAAFLPEDVDRDSYEHPTFGSSVSDHDQPSYEIGACQICGTANVPVAWPDDTDPRSPRPICIDSQACQARCEADSDPEDPMVFYDPTGARYGIPTYPFKFAPDGLATRRQLRATNLRPGGQDIAAQLLWRIGRRVAYLYRIDLAVPKRTATPAQRAALDKALTARRTCPECHRLKDYYIPRRTGACLDCTPEVTR